VGKVNSINKYSYVILSAGVGSRLGKLGTTTPKCLIQINKKNIIQNILDLLIKIGVKEVSIGIGFKAEKIKKKLKNFKKIKIKYYKIQNFKKNGSVYTLYKFKRLWFKKKKSVIMLHSDIIFDEKFLLNIIKSKKKNIVGVKKINKNLIKKKGFTVSINKKFELNEINHNFNMKKTYGEIICINKFSSKFFSSLLNYLKGQFMLGRSIETWEWLLSDFIKMRREKVHILKNQVYRWVNMNTFSDYLKAKKLFFK